MPGAHAVLSPSAAKRWMSCPPSARLEEKLKERFGDSGSAFAEEGTKAHALAELKLRKANGEINEFLFKQERAALGDITPEMEKNTDTYTDIVIGKLYESRKYDPTAQLYIEQRLDMSTWATKCFGTGDAIIVSDKTLEVCDYKNGQGVPVSAVENPQARLYGLGAINALGDLYDFDQVRNTIIQPKLYSVTEETLTREELLAWGEELKPIAEAAWKGEGEYKTGEHCRFCAAKAICAKRASEALSVVKHGFDTPDVISDEDIPGILAVLDVAEAWLKDIKTYALSQAMKGQQFRGWKLVRGRRGRRTFTDEEKVREQLMRAGYTAEQFEKRELKGVTDIEKLIGKTAFEALMDGLTVQAQGALVLAPEDDKRPEYSAADAAFADMADTAE